jgi:hypothetical protein
MCGRLRGALDERGTAQAIAADIFRIMHIMFKARWVALARVWRYYWTLLRLLLDRLLHGEGSPDENRSLAACKSI